MKELEVIKFIRAHPDNWAQLLSESPFFIGVKYGEGEYEGLVLLKYNQISSDFSNKLVQECRGIILDSLDDWAVVKCSFYKFFNYGEKEAADIVWRNAHVQDKIDGSLISCAWWARKQRWVISTNGYIDAYGIPAKGQADSFVTEKEISFGALFDSACQKQHFDLGKLKKNCTYTFELVSPYNRVVVNYPEIAIYHLSTRDNKTLQEFRDDIGIQKPTEYPLHSLDAVLIAANRLNNENVSIESEGFVVVDENWNRIKVKSPLYIAAAYMVNKKLTVRRALDITLRGEREEFISYFPQSQEAFDELDKLIERITELMDRSWNYVEAALGSNCSMKDLANFVSNLKWKQWCFYKKKNPDSNAKDFLLGLIGIRDLVYNYWKNRDNASYWTVVNYNEK